ncbi:MAG: shikimate kinase [Lacisediminihabitans sp.]
MTSSAGLIRARLVLIGASGAGKTRLGKRVAKRLQVMFIDTDKRIVVAHGPISQIFEEYGEEHFRMLERAAVAEALREDAVVSLGGGAVLDANTQADLAGQRVALLTVSAEAVARRIGGGKRPLLKDGINAWVALVESRRKLYERLASRSWDTSKLPLDDIADDIADWIRNGTAPVDASAEDVVEIRTARVDSAQKEQQ